MSQSLKAMPWAAPAAETIPVNPYEESARTSSTRFFDEMRERIQEDLSDFGVIESIEGEIVRTQRHGVVFDDVVAMVRHPRIRVPMKINIMRNAEDGSLSYTNELGNEISMRPRTYSGQVVMRHDEKELMDELMSRIDAHPAWANWTEDDAAKVSGVRGASRAAVGGAMTGLTAPIAADLLLWDPGLVGTTTLSLTGMIAMGIMSFFGVGIKNLVSIKKADKNLDPINDAVAEWNGDLKQTFSSLFTSPEEKALFFDAFLASCKAAGVEYQGGLKVAKAPRRLAWHSLDLNQPWSKDEQTDSPWLTLLRGMPFFIVKGDDGLKRSMVFDGRRLYYHPNNGKIYPIG